MPDEREDGEKMIFAIDPGNIQSAYVILDDNLKPVMFEKLDNEMLLQMIYRSIGDQRLEHFVLETIASYGMAVGQEVFETCWWSGRFWEASLFIPNMKKVYRKEVKLNLCHSARAKDGNVIQALKDRFGGRGTKSSPGWFYGVKADAWQAYACGVSYADLYLKDEKVAKK